MGSWIKGNCSSNEDIFISLAILILLVNNVQNCCGSPKFMADGTMYARPPSVCVDIPTSLKLCRNVGYTRMVLPNLLNHESLTEVVQQATSFVPLLSRHCHANVQVFLCSLFAPVCIPTPPGESMNGPIPPCRSLCESVERRCGPIMLEHGFSWPLMLNCSKFSNEGLCVSPDVNGSTTAEPPLPSTAPNPVCPPCRIELQRDTLLDNYCASEFVIKIRVKKIKNKKSRGIREVFADKKKRVIYKNGPLDKRDNKKMKLYVIGRKRCTCPQLDDAVTKKPRRGRSEADEHSRSKRGARKKKNKKGGKKKRKKKKFYLVMGRKDGRKLKVTVIHAWDKNKRILNTAARNNFGARDCPSFDSTGSAGR
uniref:Secreted frizzled-related protein n=1 Tax=Ciona intestinalis TaxID=7719 RepID=Q4H2U5_CIOIN|nr:secreted frizzled-related protein precursor [Ciona intestinalis]BAE06682.1 secreted frizzled-related protein [Ciona intestinalis]|eukprot:NP_001071964.1 secreted frizzled-related protein precursor [Ciona intestinalis]